MFRTLMVCTTLLALLGGCGGDANPSPPDGSVERDAVANLDSAADARAPGTCSTSAECDDRVQCTVDRCDMVAQRCEHRVDPSQCMGGQTCDPRRGCVAGRACMGDANCMDTDPCTVNERCDPGSRVCIYDLFDGDGDREPPRSCGGQDCNDADNQIAPSARERCNGQDDNCNGRVDEEATDCGRGTTCRNGGCECTVTPPEGLMLGRVQLCTPRAGRSMTICTDVRTDSEGCGRMCETCPSGTRCMNGSCACPTTGEAYCMRSDFDSGPRWENGCYNLNTNLNHCGRCGRLCPEGAARCEGGMCVCRDGLARCTAGPSTVFCADLQTDRGHCGFCFNACEGAEQCRNGSCTL